jgi:hypothetical protein
MGLVEIVQMMNDNFENRKHGGPTKIFDMQRILLEKFHSVIGVLTDIFASRQYFPSGENILPDAERSLNETVANYTNSIENHVSKTL